MDTNLITQLIAALTQRSEGQAPSVTITILVLAALAPTLVALAGYLQGRSLKVHVNSKMDLLLKKSEQVAHEAGAAEQRTTTAIVDKLDNGNKISPSHPVVLAILEEIRKHGSGHK